MNQTTTIFLCEETLDSILTAVYDAYASRLGHTHIRLAFRGSYVPELFAETREVLTDSDKSMKVIRSIREKISLRAWQMVLRASLSCEDSRCDDIYRFLVGGFYFGKKVTSMLTEPAVQRIMELNRSVGNETHYYREFIKFDALNEQILLTRVRPKNDILSLVTPHFCDRIPGENFVIVDMGRKLAAVHPAQTDVNRSTRSGANWFLTELTDEEWNRLSTDTDDPYRHLWKTFFQTIAIRQRENYELQRTNMPLRYREFSPEFH